MLKEFISLAKRKDIFYWFKMKRVVLNNNNPWVINFGFKAIWPVSWYL